MFKGTDDGKSLREYSIKQRQQWVMYAYDGLKAVSERVRVLPPPPDTHRIKKKTRAQSE